MQYFMTTLYNSYSHHPHNLTHEQYTRHIKVKAGINTLKVHLRGCGRGRGEEGSGRRKGEFVWNQESNTTSKYLNVCGC